MAELRDLVPSEFKDDLSEAEKLILENAPKGEFADMRSGDEEFDKPENSDKWPESRTVRAKFLEWLLRHKKAQDFIHDKGIMILGIRIDGGLDLYSLTFPFPLIIHHSRFADGVNLGFARVKLIDFSNSHFNNLYADGLIIEQSAGFNNSRSEGEFRVVGANIGGNLSCAGAKFMNKNGYSFSGDRIATKGDVFLTQIESTGHFRLVNANVGSNLDCEGAKFRNEKANAFSGDGISTKGSVFLNGIESEGKFGLVGANIGRNLDCGRAKFINGKGKSFVGDTITTKGHVFLWEIESTGDFRLVNAHIGGNLECTGAKFINGKGEAFNGGTMITKGTVFLDEIESTGVFGLVGADIGGNLVCTGAKFMNEKGHAFSGDGLATKGNVFLRRIESRGEFRLVGAHIGSDLYCDGASFQNKGKTALEMTQAVIDGRLCLNKVEKVEGKIDLLNTNAGAFVDDNKSWPDEGKLILDGFDYGSFAEATPTEIETRLQWLKRQPQGEYIPQPYQQLAKVYRKMGRDGDAKKVLLEKERMRRRNGKLILPAKIWSYFLDLTIGYGYQIGRALGIVLFLIIYGSVLFHWAYNGKLMQEVTAEKTANLNKEFSPFVYSIDVLVPLLDLNQEKYWRPDPTVPAKSSFMGYRIGWWAQTYFIIHIMLGWVFTTLLAASLTGLIRRE